MTPLLNGGPILFSGKVAALHMEGSDGMHKVCCDRTEELCVRSNQAPPSGQVVCCNGELVDCNCLGASRILFLLDPGPNGSGYAFGCDPNVIAWLEGQLARFIVDVHDASRIADIDKEGEVCGDLVGWADPSWESFGLSIMEVMLSEVSASRKESRCVGAIPCGVSPDSQSCKYFIEQHMEFLRKGYGEEIRGCAGGWVFPSGALKKR